MTIALPVPERQVWTGMRTAPSNRPPSHRPCWISHTDSAERPRQELTRTPAGCSCPSHLLGEVCEGAGRPSCPVSSASCRLSADALTCFLLLSVGSAALGGSGPLAAPGTHQGQRGSLRWADCPSSRGRTCTE